MSITTTYADLVTTVTAGSGDQTGLSISGREPGATLRIAGTTSLASLTTGLNTGTAGSGTTSTSVAKPTGSANWTASNLVGKWFKRTGGGGYVSGGDNLRPIQANTTSTLAIATMSGVDNTTTFDIVTLGTTFDRVSSSDLVGIRLAGNLGPVEISGVDFSTAHTLDSLIDIADCVDVRVIACKFAQNLSAPSVNIARCTRVRVEHCQLQSSADIVIDTCQYVTIRDCVNSAGGVVQVSNALSVDVIGLKATSAPSTVLAITNALVATAEVNASSGGATPIYLESVGQFSTSGTGLVGTSNTGYGVEVATSGRYNFAGATITGGSGDVLFMANAETWTDLSGTDYGIATEHASAAFANANYNKSHHYGNELHLGEQQFSARVLFYGVFNPSQITGVTAAGTTTSDAYVIPQQQFVRVDTCASGAGIRIYSPAVAAVPGPEVFVVNKGANTLKVYPPTGGTIDGAGTNVAYSLASGSKKRFVCISDDRLAWESY